MSYVNVSASLVGRKVSANERAVRELQRIGPQPWLYLGEFPGEPFTRFESPQYLNDLTFVAGRRVRMRWGIDGSFEMDGVFDLTAGYVTGDDGFDINENTDEFEGVVVEQFIPLELDVGVWSAAVFQIDDLGIGRVHFPIVADPIP